MPGVKIFLRADALDVNPPAVIPEVLRGVHAAAILRVITLRHVHALGRLAAVPPAIEWRTSFQSA